MHVVEHPVSLLGVHGNVGDLAQVPELHLSRKKRERGTTQTQTNDRVFSAVEPINYIGGQ